MAKKILLLLAAISAVFLFQGRDAWAQDPSSRPSPKVLSKSPAANDGPQTDSDDLLQLFRKDVRSTKKQIVAANMDLTDVQAEKFWPVYDKYAADLSKIYDSEIALLKDYADNYTTMTGDEAESYIRKRAAIEHSIVQLRLSYIPEFRKVLSGREMALFYQIDWRLGRAIDIQLAQMPLINQ